VGCEAKPRAPYRVYHALLGPQLFERVLKLRCCAAASAVPIGSFAESVEQQASSFACVWVLPSELVVRIQMQRVDETNQYTYRSASIIALGAVNSPEPCVS
jgi:hypothetical protein